MADTPDSLRAAVLYAAIHANQVDIVRILLRLGFAVDVPFRGKTALQHSVRFLRRDIVEILLQHGADINVCDKYGDTPLSIAARAGNLDIFSLLCAFGGMMGYSSPSASEQTMHHLLYRAVEGGSHTIVAMVLEQTRADPNTRFEDCTTPLSLASERGHDEVVKLLLVQGADPNAEAMPLQRTEKRGSWKALHAAAHGGHAKIVEMLVQHGDDVNARTECDDTPLTLVLEGQRESARTPVRWEMYKETARALLARGAVLDGRSSILLRELESEPDSSFGREVPGAWLEDAEERLDSDSDSN